MKYYHIIFAIILSGILGCSKKADIKLPDSENKLVVTCFITPNDSVITATVRQSKPKFGSAGTSSYTTGYDIDNATVIISDGNQSIQLSHDNMFFYYKSTPKQMAIVPGKKYFLTVRVPDGRQVDASTTVPEKKLNIELFTYRISKQDSVSIKFTVNAIINDNANQTDYLAIYNQTNFSIIRNDTIYDQNNYYGESGYFDDDEKIGKTNFYYDYANDISSLDTIYAVNTNLSVLSCNKDFYLYNKSVQAGGLNGGNPFADPVLIYTNINNGFGCFGAYIGNDVSKKIR